ncbi:MAG: hypothetical protein MJB57_12985 [Gemmatimonadetes bacterium]|nr:hypothetical protein [Gemmatimonadota bacterium]
MPVEDTGGSGTVNAHWRETVFGGELMTGWIDPGSNPLSLVTVQSMADMGYTVDTAAADSYAVPSALLVPAPDRGRASVRMIDDIWIVPIEILASDGSRVGLYVR